MKITLFLSDRCIAFTLPNQISGSYSFDENPEEEDKLINIEAENNKWILYSTELVHVMENNNFIDKLEIHPNTFYAINRNNVNYLIYSSNIANTIVSTYIFDENSSITIGNNNSQVIYNCPLLDTSTINIKNNGNQIALTNNECNFCYINNKRIPSGINALKYGDIITLLGIKITVMPKLIIFNTPSNEVNFENIGIELFKYNIPELKNIPIKDIELYNQNNYFAKSPRIRRQIEEKDISLDRPPKLKSEEKTPLILTIGPMISLMASSGITLLSTVMRISEGTTTFKQSWTSFATCGVMILTSLLWPIITRAYNRYLDKKNNKEVREKYKIYLDDKDKELQKEYNLQKMILEENLISNTECINIIKTSRNNFWIKRKEQKDFLEVRIGTGQVPLKVKINFPKDGFTIEEDELKKIADEVVEKNSLLNDVPVGYSLYDNYFTSIMGPEELSIPFTNNILLQLMTFYGYDELKFIIFTDEKRKSNWDYLKYCSYNFNNSRTVRYFAENNDEYKELSDYLVQELDYRISVSNNSNTNIGKEFNSYYVIVCDNYRETKKTDFFKKLVEVDKNLGYSCLFIENTLSNLPSKCVNFISLNTGASTLMKNSFEDSKMVTFRNEIINNIDMSEMCKIVSNIPLEIKDEDTQLPNSISFLEMEKVGKVEQLNILNRWSTNNSVKSLKAEIGVNSENELMYLDLHEKEHGPHGLIAGMTGSGKSEFIITYILSMAMNYSPDDISFVLIDYKGGGLAGAFENNVTGIRLPHLAGTITNLDKSEMNRTLVSIDSEVKRRQELFNIARDNLRESTIDIYKYQEFYHQGKIQEPIPHLFIICDEFAELKSQQPDFMENLISVARIGRSLGVHLILATQKPSGVVNEQIWSNSKFRVCLKVQDASDSNEMLKKPDAANIKQAGRFYLQVGYDELYELGQSAWCGAKYFPQDKPVKVVDKSLNFISNLGINIKNVTDDTAPKVASQGEEIASILKEIIDVSKQTNKIVHTLWLPSIPENILVESLITKYQVTNEKYDVSSIIGEYDAPEFQKQGIVNYNFVKRGNLAVYGMDGTDKDKILQTMVYSICNNYSVDEVNIYAIDYGSEFLRIYNNIPHFGGVICQGDEEKYPNLINLLKEEIKKRKDLFINTGGEYINYIKNTDKPLPLKLILINNIDSAKSSISTLNDDLIEITRDSNRYGIVFVITANNSSSLGIKISQNFPEAICLKLKELFDYTSLLGVKVKNEPRDITGRGVCVIDGSAHEFQTASIVEDENTLNEFISNFITTIRNKYPNIKAKKIPSLPVHVKLEDISDSINNYTDFPIGIYKEDLSTATFNFLDNIGNLILSNKTDNIYPFAKSMLEVITKIDKNNIIFIDSGDLYKDLPINTYCNSNYEAFITNLYNSINNNLNKDFGNTIIIFNGISKIAPKIDNKKLLEDLFTILKKVERIPVILFDEGSKIKQVYLESWYRIIFNGYSGLWIGSGLTEQSILKVSTYNKEFRLNYKCDMGFLVNNGDAKLVKLLDFTEEGADKQ